MGPDWSRIFVGFGPGKIRPAVTTPHISSMTNTRVVGVPPLVIPLFPVSFYYLAFAIPPAGAVRWELGNRIFTTNDTKFVKIRSIGSDGW